MSAYAELHCLSDFSFQRGASSARELFERAKACGYAALAVTDECSLAGIVRAWQSSREVGVPLIVGSEFQLDDGPKVVVLVENQAGYETLCALITDARRASTKGNYRIVRAAFERDLTGLLALWVPGRDIAVSEGHWVARTFAERAWLAVELHRGPDDDRRLAELREAGRATGLALVAAGDVHMHARSRRALQDVMTAVRHRLTVAMAGEHLFRNGERHLRAIRTLSNIYPHELLAESVRIARRCTFDLSELKYQYPAELVPSDHTPTTWLRALTEEGVRWRWPGGEPAKVRAQIEHELSLIEDLHYEAYFLTVHDIVRFARSRGILCQGRGSAANSAVCFALGVTEVDPGRLNLLVERFISKERNEPPDIDIDFEHERREEVIQYIYGKYGRERAALAATVICYRGKSAVRDVAKALGWPADQLEPLSRVFAWWDGTDPLHERLAERGLDADSPMLRRILVLTSEILDRPRHLSQHVGGFVIADRPLWTLVPVENAAMPDRTILQWDKDDLDALGLLKVDCLALGMLTCVQKCLNLLRAHRGQDLTMATLPPDCDKTFAMIQSADTLGVFQIESRAQMSMLPRHLPKDFYDLVIQVAIVRPGPIQGDMIHPYLRRRRGEEPVDYPSEDLRVVFERTLGVPLFQEQVMKLAIVAAGYTAGEADQLRRAMAAWKRAGGMDKHRERIMQGMRKRGYTTAFAEQLFEQIKGFGSYGFPESHAASFAGIVWASCWLKCHEPAAFACALLNSQPMGFYAPAQIVQDAQRHGVKVLAVDVRSSDWDCTLDGGDSERQPMIRLGFGQVRGFRKETAGRISEARGLRAFTDIGDLCERAQLDARDRELLADAGALRALVGHRHRARWATTGVEVQRPLFGLSSPEEGRVHLAPPTQAQDTLADFRRVGVSLGPHPVRQIRARLRAARWDDPKVFREAPHETRVRVAGIVTLRQRPSTASGVTFVTMEDEAGLVNVIVWLKTAEKQRRELLEARLLGVDGQWENVEGVRHVVAHRLFDLSSMLGELDVRSRDFH